MQMDSIVSSSGSELKLSTMMSDLMAGAKVLVFFRLNNRYGDKIFSPRSNLPNITASSLYIMDTGDASEIDVGFFADSRERERQLSTSIHSASQPNLKQAYIHSRRCKIDVIVNHLLEFSFCNLRRYSLEYPLIVQALRESIEHYHSVFENNDNLTKCKLRAALDTPKLLGLDVHLLHREDERRLIFEAAYVMTLFMMPSSRQYIISSIEELTGKYPSFVRVEEKELMTLLKYRNMMAIAILVLPPKSKKAHLLDLVTRIVEGNDVRYITGSGETVSTRRRVTIYETEGNITPLPRPPRRSPNESNMSRLKKEVSVSRQSALFPSNSSLLSNDHMKLLTTSTHEGATDTMEEALSSNPQSYISKRKRADSEVNFNEAAKVLLLLYSQAGLEGRVTRSRSNSLVEANGNLQQLKAQQSTSSFQ